VSAKESIAFYLFSFSKIQPHGVWGVRQQNSTQRFADHSQKFSHLFLRLFRRRRMQTALQQRLSKTAGPRNRRPSRLPSKPSDGQQQPSSSTPGHTTGVAFLIAQMLFCLIGINLCFGWWSVKQERVIKKPYAVMILHANAAAPQTEILFLTTTYGISLSQTMTGFLVSAMLLGFHSIVRQRTGGRETASPPPTDAGNAEPAATYPGRPPTTTALTLHDAPVLLAMGFSNLFASSLGYAAMRHLSYPVTLTAKMCKMVPVMLVGSVWYHIRYPARKVVSCLVITGGVLAFALQDQRSHGSSDKRAKTGAAETTLSSSLLGAVFMLMNLLMDGYTNSTQDMLVKRHRWSGPLLMMWANLVSFVCALFVMVLLECGEQPWTWLCASVDLLFAALPRGAAGGSVMKPTHARLSFVPFHDLSNFLGFLAHCEEARHDVLLMSLLNAVGQLFIFHTISLFGTLAVTAMTLVRKAGSVLLSIYVHHHSMQPSQWAALLTIFVGIVGEGYSNVQDASKRQQQQQQKERGLVESSQGAPLDGLSPPSARTPPPASASAKVPRRTISSSSSTAMMTDSRSTTPVYANA
jgi:solute carrier family 35 (UDP-galactose transporter), member B1